MHNYTRHSRNQLTRWQRLIISFAKVKTNTSHSRKSSTSTAGRVKVLESPTGLRVNRIFDSYFEGEHKALLLCRLLQRDSHGSDPDPAARKSDMVDQLPVLFSAVCFSSHTKFSEGNGPQITKGRMYNLCVHTKTTRPPFSRPGRIMGTLHLDFSVQEIQSSDRKSLAQ